MDAFITGNSTIDSLIALAGTIVPVVSAFAGVFNARIRSAQAAGEAIAPGVLKVVAGLNVVAVNLDKAKQLMALARAGGQPPLEPGKPCPTCGQNVPAVAQQ